MNIKTKEAYAELAGNIFGVVAVFFLCGFLVEWIWNSTVVSMFSAKSISYFDSLKLLLLTSILFKSTTSVLKKSS
jgi:hypothetical protein